MAEEEVKVEETVKAEEPTQTEQTTQESSEAVVEENQQSEAVVETNDDDTNISVDDSGMIKIDLRKKPKEDTNAVQEQSPDEISVRNESETSGAIQEQNNEKADEEPTGESAPVDTSDAVLELIQEDEQVEEQQTLSDKIKDIPNKLKEESEGVNNNQEVNELPENVEKLIDFMKETGGTLEDYVSLNKDYSKMEDMDILREHYRKSKPHLNEEEISFLIEDSFSYDEDVDDEKEIKRKKLLLKENIAEAKSNLNSLKSRYYDDLKLSSKLTTEQLEAVEFYDQYRKEQESTQELAKKQRSIFEQKTNKLFSNDFKGFEYKVGNNKYRFNVKDADRVKETQGDINSLISKFTNNENEMSDTEGYHKALFTAMNADSIANHFYEQGKADAIKESMAKSKNIDMNPRGTHEAVTTTSGMRVKAISGDDSSRLRIKLKQ